MLVMKRGSAKAAIWTFAVQYLAEEPTDTPLGLKR
jgi:hypothetical protein